MSNDQYETNTEPSDDVRAEGAAPLTMQDLDQWEREIIEYCRQTLDELRQLGAGASSGTFHTTGGIAGVGSPN